MENNGQQGGILSDKAVGQLMAKVLTGLARTCLREGPQLFDIDGDGDPELVAMHLDNVPSDVQDYAAHVEDDHHA